MAKRLSAEQIVTKLRQIEVLQAKAIRKEAVMTEQSYCRWRKEYGGWALIKRRS